MELYDSNPTINFSKEQVEESLQGDVFFKEQMLKSNSQSNKKFYIESYGCQMNFSDSEIVASILSDMGYEPTREMEIADLILVNTCSIREKAEETVRKRLRVFDKVKENTKGITVGSRMTFSEAANLALNQTLVRSINTSLVAILPVVSILIVGVTQLGSGTLNDLALALFVGMVVGTFSSIFIATPFLAQIKERQPEMKALAKRVAIRREKDGDERVIVAKVSGSSIVHQSGPRQQIVKKSRSARKGH
jgi:hypothetical protein